MHELATAAVHYFRIPRADWGRVLDSLASAGFKGIDVYVPWGVHEKGESDYDFGRREKNLDLVRFIELVEERGLWIILRPGPCVNAELGNFGLPDRVIWNRDVQALSPGGNPVLCPFFPEPFPAPSYASRAYLEETRKWYEKVCSVLGDLGRNRELVRMVQVDNEGTLFFRDGPFDQDYRPEALELFAQWLEEREEEPFEPPRSLEPGMEGLRRALMWIRFRERMVIRGLGLMRGHLEACGLSGCTFSHNLPPGGMFNSLPPSELKEAVDMVTTDIYCTAPGSRAAMHQVQILSSVEEEPFAGEMGSGTVFYTPYITEFDNKFVVAASLASGLKGFNIYMGHGRDRWLGGPVSTGGEADRSSLLHFYQRLIELAGRLELGNMAPLVPAAVLVPRQYVRHTFAAFPFTGMSPPLLSGLGLRLSTFLSGDESSLGAPIQKDWLERMEGILDILQREALFYAMGEGKAGLESIRRRHPGLRAVFVPSFVYMERGVLEASVECARDGLLVVAGPGRPQLDENLRPQDGRLLEELDEQIFLKHMVVVKDLKGDADLAGRLAEVRSAFEEPLPLRLARKHLMTSLVVHGRGEKDRWLVFVVHRSEEEASTVLEIEKGWSCERVLRLVRGVESGEFARTRWKKDRVVSLDHEGCDLNLLEIRREGA